MGSNSLPILDCSNLDKNLDEFAQKLGNAFEEFGFVYLVNHEFKQEKVEKFTKTMQEFYNLPLEIKLKYKMGDPFENFFGYTPAGVERFGDDSSTGAKDTKEAFDFSSPDAYDPTKYATEIPNFKNIVDEFRSPLKELVENLLRAFAIYLNLDSEIFLPMHSFDYRDGCFTLLRSILYPPAVGHKENGDVVRLGNHQDMGTFTFLFQDGSGGLESLGKDGDWVSVPPIPGAITVMTGQTLECWSGGKIKAVMHRVRAHTSDINTPRQTHVFFVAADLNVPITPKVQLQSDWIPIYENEKETTGEFIARRFAGARQ